MPILYYSLCLLILSTFCLRKSPPSQGINNLLCFFIILCFTILYGLRDLSSGTDTSTYAHLYENIQSTNSGTEKGFQYFMEILSHFNISVHGFILSITLLTLFCIWLSIINAPINFKQYSPLIFLLILSSYSAFDLLTNGIRQGLGLSIGMVGVMIFFRRKVIGVLLLSLGILFHTSVVILLGTAFIAIFVSRYKRITFFLGIFSLFLLAFVLLTGVNIQALFVQQFSNLIQNYEPNIAYRLSLYNESTKGLFNSLQIKGKIVDLLPVIIPISLYLLLYSRIADHFARYLFLVVLFPLILYFMSIYQSFSFRYMYISILLSQFITVGSLFQANILNITFRLKAFLLIILVVGYSSYFIWLGSVYGKFGY